MQTRSAKIALEQKKKLLSMSKVSIQMEISPKTNELKSKNSCFKWIVKRIKKYGITTSISSIIEKLSEEVPDATTPIPDVQTPNVPTPLPDKKSVEKKSEKKILSMWKRFAKSIGSALLSILRCLPSLLGTIGGIYTLYTLYTQFYSEENVDNSLSEEDVLKVVRDNFRVNFEIKNKQNT